MAKIYTVRPGDSLGLLAEAGGVSLADILALNPQIEDPDRIYSGQSILLPATVSRSRLLAAKAEVVFSGDEPVWLKIARGEIGTSEISGRRANPRIVEYLASTTLPAGPRATDETAWCSAFVNWCLTTSGIAGTRSAWALDWRGYGRAAETPVKGAIAVFSRSTARGEGGHVAFLLDDLGDKVRVLGGNQGNRVSITTYPKAGVSGGTRYRLLDLRLP